MTLLPRKRRWWLLIPAGLVAIMILLALASLLLAWWRPGEPVHRGRPISAWGQDLAAGDPAVRSNAVAVIRELPPEARDYFTQMLARQDPALKKPYTRFAPHLPNWLRRTISRVFNPFRPGQQRWIAMEALVVLGTNAPPDALARALYDPEPAIALRASQALADLGPPGLPHLLAAVNDTNRNVVALAAGALARTGPWASNAVPALVRQLAHPDPSVFNPASAALQRLAPASYPALCDALRDPDENLRRLAARTLGNAGTVARSTAPSLVAASRDPSPNVRLEVIDALGKVGPFANESVQALVVALDDSSSLVRARALESLKRAYRFAGPAVPRVTGLLDSPDAATRLAALAVLANVGPEAASSRAAVNRLTNDPDPLVSEQARQTLARIDAPRSP